VAAAIWIVRKSTNNRADTIDGIETVIINNDNLDNEATTLADTEAALQAAGYDIPTGYFDSADLALSAGQLDADGDLVAVGKRIEIIA
jgi:hypothetical protein